MLRLIYYFCHLSSQKVPEGDWFCDQCKPKEKTPRKRRKLYTDEDAEEDLDER